MPRKLIFGPVLGLDAEDTYTVCFVTDSGVSEVAVTIDEKEIIAVEVQTLPGGGKFWRAATKVNVPNNNTGRFTEYSVNCGDEVYTDKKGRSSWKFYVPGTDEEPRIAYTSCNGVSKSDLIAKMDDPFKLWEEMVELHSKEPFSLMLMGGDQIYADSIWDKVKALEEWSSLKVAEQLRRKVSKPLSAQLDQFYSKLYTERWSEENMSFMLASVPSIMMWDDHDIFDGWGSFPKNLQQSAIFSEIFLYAKKYFELFQIRSKENSSLLSRDAGHFSLNVKFRNYNILALDNRSERSITQVMSSQHWDDVIRCLNSIDSGNLIVMSAVPVVYRDFSFTETAFDVTPWDESLADDLKDHWRAKEHQGERSRLIMRLLENAATRNAEGRESRTIILSGDVHVGCLGIINDRSGEKLVKIHQIVSSGIIHPAPSLIQWLGIKAVTNDDDEALNEERTIEASMLTPVGSKKYIRARNFVTLQKGTDGKIWVNWIVDGSKELETGEHPVYPIS